jgi:hypothetical protein
MALKIRLRMALNFSMNSPHHFFMAVTAERRKPATRVSENAAAGTPGIMFPAPWFTAVIATAKSRAGMKTSTVRRKNFDLSTTFLLSVWTD